MYAKDLSRKIKSAKQQRAQNGFYISAQPPYGYKVNPYNRNQLIVDHEVAPVVKFIFELAEQGKSFSEISRILEAERYISPSAYKVMNGDTRFLKYTKAQTQIYKWSYQTVRAILNNRVYVGDMVNHKVEVANYKTKERVRIPPEKQIIVPNTHEAIIERERFEKISTKVSKRRNSNHKYENLFKGILFCSECGAEMQLISKKLKYENKPMFICPKHLTDKSVCSHYRHMYYDELLNEIQKQLETLIDYYISSDEYKRLCEKVFNFICSQIVEKRMSSLQNDLSTISKQIKECYKRRADGTQDVFKSDELKDLLERQKALILKIGEINTASPCLINNDLIMREVMLKVKEHIRDIVFNKNNIKHFIKRIEIDHLEKCSDGMEKRITLHYKF